MVTPKELKDILSILESTLQREHPLLSLEHSSVYGYYTLNNVVSFMEDHDLYIKVPVVVSLQDQTFDLYSLKQFAIPVPNMSEQAMILQHKDMIAINMDANTYFAVDKHELQQCYGHTTLICPQLFTQHLLEKSESCELSIFQEDLAKVKDLCNFGLLNIHSLQTKFYYVRDNKILIVNPSRSKIFKMCKKDKIQEYLSDEFVLDINLECFCYILADKTISPVFADDNCHDTTSFSVHDPTENILYIALLLNQSIIDMKHYNATTFIPTLNLPEVPNNMLMSDDILDLKNILYERTNGYENTVIHRLNKHSSIFENFSVVKMLAYGVPILTGIIIILAIIFLLKTKNLGSLITMANMIKSAKAAPVDTRNIMDIATDSIIILLAFLIIVYIIIRYFKLFKKAKQYMTLPFNSCVAMKQSPKIEIILYIENINDFCMIFIDQLQYTPPSKIKLIQNENLPLALTLHTGCMTNYLTYSKELKIEINNEQKDVYQLPNAVHVPIYLKEKVVQILRDNYTSKILVGTAGIYFNHDLKQ